jgi:hypothetical protein
MEINHHVHSIRQPNRNDCWATCVAMLLGLDGLAGVAEVKRRATGVSLYPNGSIRPRSVPDLARILHLNLTNLHMPPRMLSADVLSHALHRSAAAAFGNYNYPGANSSTMHVFLLYRLSGSDSDPMIHFIDPYVGRSFNYMMEEFNENLGSVDYILFR